MSNQTTKFGEAADDERYALELRAEVLSTISSASEVRRGSMDRLEIGKIAEDDGTNGGIDVVSGTESIVVGGDLEETVGHGRISTAHNVSLKVHGRMALDAVHDNALLTGTLNETHHGGEFLAAGMSDDLIGGIGVRTTSPADLWLTGLIGIEEKVATTANDVVTVDMYAVGMEREFATSVHNMGCGIFGGAMYTTLATGFMQLHQIQRGVRNTIPGGEAGGGNSGNAPAGAPTPGTAADAPAGAPDAPDAASTKSASRLDALDPNTAKQAGLLVERRRHRTFSRIASEVDGFREFDDTSRMVDVETARAVAHINETATGPRPILAHIMENLHAAAKAAEDGGANEESFTAFRKALEESGDFTDGVRQRFSNVGGDEARRAPGASPSTADAPGYRPSRPQNPDAPPPSVLVHAATNAPPTPTAANDVLATPPRTVDDAWGDLVMLRERTDWFYQGHADQTNGTPTGLHLRAHALISTKIREVQEAYVAALPTFSQYLQVDPQSFAAGGNLATPSRFTNGSAIRLVRSNAPSAALLKAEPASRLRIRDEYLKAIENARAAGDEAAARTMQAALAEIDAGVSATIDRTLAGATAFTEWRGAPLPAGTDRRKLIEELERITDSAADNLFSEDEITAAMARVDISHFPRMVEIIETGSDPRPYFLEILLDARASQAVGMVSSAEVRALEMEYKLLDKLLRLSSFRLDHAPAPLALDFGVGFAEPLESLKRIQTQTHGGSPLGLYASHRLASARLDIDQLIQGSVQRAYSSYPLDRDLQLLRQQGRDQLLGMRHLLLQHGHLDEMLELERIITELDAQVLATIDDAVREAEMLANPPPLPAGLDAAALDQELGWLQTRGEAEAALDHARARIGEGRDPRPGLEYRINELRKNSATQEAADALDGVLQSLNRLIGKHQAADGVPVPGAGPFATPAARLGTPRHGDVPGSLSIVLGNPKGAPIPVSIAAPPQALFDEADEAAIHGLLVGEPRGIGSTTPGAAKNAHDAPGTIPGSVPPPMREDPRPQFNDKGASWSADSTARNNRHVGAPEEGNGSARGDDGLGRNEGGDHWQSMPAGNDRQSLSIGPVTDTRAPVDERVNFDYPETGGFLDQLAMVKQRRDVNYHGDPGLIASEQLLFRAENQAHDYAEIVLAEALYLHADKVHPERLEIPPPPGAIAARGGLLQLQRELIRADEVDAAANVGESIRQLDRNIDSMLENHLNAAEHFAQNPPPTENLLSSVHGGGNGTGPGNSASGGTTNTLPDLNSFPNRVSMPGDDPMVDPVARQTQEMLWRSMIASGGETVGTENLRVGHAADDRTWLSVLGSYLYQTGQVDLSPTYPYGELVDPSISPKTILSSAPADADLHRRIGRNLEAVLQQRRQAPNYRLNAYEQRLLDFVARQPTSTTPAPRRRRFWPFNFWPLLRGLGSATRHEDIYGEVPRLGSARPSAPAPAASTAPAPGTILEYDYINQIYINGNGKPIMPADRNRPALRNPRTRFVQFYDDMPAEGWIVDVDADDLDFINNGELVLEVLDPTGAELSYGDFRLRVTEPDGSITDPPPFTDFDRLLAAIRERKLEERTSPRAQQVGNWARDVPLAQANGNSGARMIGTDEVPDIIRGIPMGDGETPRGHHWDRLPMPDEAAFADANADAFAGANAAAYMDASVDGAIAEVHALSSSDVSAPRGNIAVIEARLEEVDSMHLATDRDATAASTASPKNVARHDEAQPDLLFTFTPGTHGEPGRALTVPGPDARAILGGIKENAPVLRLDLPSPPPKPVRMRQGTAAVTEAERSSDLFSANEATANLIPKPFRRGQRIPHGRQQVLAFLLQAGEASTDPRSGKTTLNPWQGRRAGRLDPAHQEIGWQKLRKLRTHTGIFPNYQLTEFDVRLVELMSEHRSSFDELLPQQRIGESFLEWFDNLVASLQH